MAKEYDEFFEKPEPQSVIKKEIVTRYFPVWTGIMFNTVKSYNRVTKDYRLGYIDLYCGPGIYDNGFESTPIEIMRHILSKKEYRENFVTIFNDSNPKAIDSLESNFKKLDNYELLSHEPSFSCDELCNDTIEDLEKDIIPSFIFLDPFGYKGISIKLISNLVKSFGCDIILFFNYNSIQRFLTVDSVEPCMKGLFTDDIFEELTEYLSSNPNANREEAIMSYYKKALKSNGVKIVLPFKFTFDNMNKTSHYLIFMTKHEKGAQEIKNIMWSVSSSKKDNIASFEFIPGLHDKPTQYTLFDMINSKFNDLKDHLLEKVSYILKHQHMITVEEIYCMYAEEVYTNKNIKDALLSLEKDDKITVIGRKTKNLSTLPAHCEILIKKRVS